jgi:hypothetical protein
MNDVQPADAGRPATLLPVLTWAAIYVMAAVAALLPGVDADLWWHLRTGQWVVANGAVPVTDPFSRYGLDSGRPWIAYSWLFEVLVFGVYQAAGFAGISLLRVLLALAVVAALHRLVAKRESRYMVAAGITCVAVVALLPLFRERPWLFTVLFSTLTLDAILDLRAGKKTWTVWLLPLVFVLWANLHIQVIYGLFMLGLACVAPVFDWLLGWGKGNEGEAAARGAPGSEDSTRGFSPKNPGCGTTFNPSGGVFGTKAPGGVFGTRGHPWRRLVVLTVLCTAATFLTPYHYHLYAVVVEHASQRVTLRYVTEMQALGFRDWADWAVLFLAGAAAFSLGRRRQLSTFDLLLLAAAAWFTFRARRDIWFLTLAAVAVIATSGPAGAVARPFLPTRRQALAGAAALCCLVLAGWVFANTGDRLQPILEKDYPVQAVRWIKDHHPAGPLFNHYNWGGYLIWELPELPVSMDGRANLHGDDRLQRATVTWFGQPGWDEDPDLVSARLILSLADEPLTALLRKEPARFEVVYEDKQAVLFVPRPSAPPPADQVSARRPAP